MRDKNLYQKNLILEFLDITQKNNLLEMKSTQKSRNEWLRNKKKKRSRTKHIVRIHELFIYENNSVYVLFCYMMRYISFFTYADLGFYL